MIDRLRIALTASLLVVGSTTVSATICEAQTKSHPVAPVDADIGATSAQWVALFRSDFDPGLPAYWLYKALAEINVDLLKLETIPLPASQEVKPTHIDRVQVIRNLLRDRYLTPTDDTTDYRGALVELILQLSDSHATSSDRPAVVIPTLRLEPVIDLKTNEGTTVTSACPRELVKYCFVVLSLPEMTDEQQKALMARIAKRVEEIQLAYANTNNVAEWREPITYPIFLPVESQSSTVIPLTSRPNASNWRTLASSWLIPLVRISGFLSAETYDYRDVTAYIVEQHSFGRSGESPVPICDTSLVEDLRDAAGNKWARNSADSLLHLSHVSSTVWTILRSFGFTIDCSASPDSPSEPSGKVVFMNYESFFDWLAGYSTSHNSPSYDPGAFSIYNVSTALDPDEAVYLGKDAFFTLYHSLEDEFEGEQEEANTLLIASAPNVGPQYSAGLCPVLPACLGKYRTVITVSALDDDGRSPRTPYATFPFPVLAAPGTDIVTDLSAFGLDFPLPANASGSSQATAIVSGLASVIAAQSGHGMTASELKRLLIGTSDALDTGYADAFIGRINAAAAAQAAREHSATVWYSGDAPVRLESGDLRVVDALGVAKLMFGQSDKGIYVCNQLVSMRRHRSEGDPSLKFDFLFRTHDGYQIRAGQTISPLYNDSGQTLRCDASGSGDRPCISIDRDGAGNYAGIDLASVEKIYFPTEARVSSSCRD